MSWIQRLTASLRGRKLEEDLDKELAFHLDMRVREKTSAGAAPEEARREVLRRFGSLARTKEACREESSLAGLAALRQDLRYAVRNLHKNPGFTAAAVACLAMGIGANTAIFSFVNAFLFQRVPAGVVRVGRASGNPIAYPEFQDWRRLNPVFDLTFAFSPGERFTIGHGAESEPALGEMVTGDYFQTLRVVPFAGRMLAPVDDSRPLAVLGYPLWRRRFHSDPAISGKTIWINRQALTIAGVAPAGFHGMLAPWSTDVWVTPALHPERLADRRMGSLGVAARLKPGITAGQADAAMKTLDARLAIEFPDPQRSPHDPLVVQRLSGLSGSPVWSVFLAVSALLMAVAGIIYLVACANVAGLLIARASARRREIVVRLSLGASRARLVRQLLTESFLLGLLGAAAGVAVAFTAGDGIAALMPRSISGGFPFQHSIDPRVLAFSLALAVASTLFAGLLPAMRASGENLASAGRTHTALGGRRPRLRQWLIVAQVAASVLVLAVAGMFVRSLQKMNQLDPGFQTAKLLTVGLDFNDLHYSRDRLREVYAQLKEGIGRVPGVESASLAELLPLGSQRVVNLPQLAEVACATVDADYFRSMGIALLHGREPRAGEPNVVVVNQALAARLWPGVDAVGKTVRVGRLQTLQQVVGVTATGKYWSLAEPARPFLYRFSTLPDRASASLAIRTSAAAGAMADAVARELGRLNPDLSAVPVETGEERLRVWLQPRQSAAVLLAILGAAALGLAIVGLYALLAQLVVERAPEIAVRVTLGASRGAVLGLLLRQSGILIGSGAAGGLLVSAILLRLLAAAVGEIGAPDRLVFLAIAGILATVGAAATAAPAYRALRIDPARALRSE